ncbi:MFS transporter [Roseibium aquae]|uniref:MFS transporter n=1 Tax=Roseibium aquae TaxID=1323746 RepID=A0A916X176_9HYPH|nr:MFS transporter [Roseibium aquae]GGB51505.1 MFS transporter [Roseibium aquae]
MGQTLAPISALLLSVACFVLGHGLQSTLLPLAAESAGFTDLEIGVISSGYFVGMVLGCLGAPHVIMRAGHIRAFAAMVSLMSAAAIVHPIIVDPIAWFVIRTVSGFCLAAFYMIVESWLNERATNENRGGIMSLYIVILFGSMVVGQVSISGMDINSFVPFAIASVTASLAVLPVTLTTSTQPAPIALVQFRPKKLYNNSPAAFVGSLLVGVTNGTLWTMTPLYGSQIGFTTNQAAFFSAAIIAGGMLFQWPAGKLSDLIDRRIVLLGLAGFTGLTALAISLINPTDFLIATGMVLIIGIFSQPAYAVAVAHGFDYADPEDFVETSSGLLLAFGIGSIFGPLIASLLMERLGPTGLFWMIVVVSLALVAFLLTRLVAREAMDPDDKTDFEYSTTAQVGSVITPEPLDVDADNVVPPEEFPAYEDDIYNFDTGSGDRTSGPEEEAGGTEEEAESQAPHPAR